MPEGFTFTPRALKRVAVACIVLLAAGSVATQLVRLTTGHDTLLGLVPELDLNAERNVPSWYSTCTLVACGLALAVMALAKREQHDRFARHWAWLSAIFVVLSIDEFVSLHERLNGPLRAALGTTGLLYFPWVLVGGAFALTVALAYLPFLLSLDPRARWRFVVSGAIYVGGAIGMEILAAPLYEAAGKNSVPELALITIEEVMELTGSTMFLFSVLAELHRMYASVAVRAGEAAPGVVEARPRGARLELFVSPRAARRVLLFAIVALLAVSLSAEALKYGAGWRLGSGERIVNVAMEGSIPTWFSFLLMLACAFWCVAAGGTLVRARTPQARTWLLLAGLLTYMSIDEAAALHERAVRPMRLLLDSPRVLNYAWVVPGAVVVIAVGVLLRGWARTLPRDTRRAFVRAAVVFVAGALGVEALGGWYAAVWGRATFGYAVLTTIEEGGEMAGLAMFLVALLRYAEAVGGTLSFGRDRPAV